MVKGETIMPVPEGQITGSEIWTQPAEPEVVEEVEDVKEEKIPWEEVKKDLGIE